MPCPLPVPPTCPPHTRSAAQTAASRSGGWALSGGPSPPPASSPPLSQWRSKRRAVVPPALVVASAAMGQRCRPPPGPPAAAAERCWRMTAGSTGTRWRSPTWRRCCRAAPWAGGCTRCVAGRATLLLPLLLPTLALLLLLVYMMLMPMRVCWCQKLPLTPCLPCSPQGLHRRG